MAHTPLPAPGHTYTRLCPSGPVSRTVLEVIAVHSRPLWVRYRTEIMGRELVRRCSVKSFRRWVRRAGTGDVDLAGA